MENTLIIATRNPGKTKEFKRLFARERTIIQKCHKNPSHEGQEQAYL